MVKKTPNFRGEKEKETYEVDTSESPYFDLWHLLDEGSTVFSKILRTILSQVSELVILFLSFTLNSRCADECQSGAKSCYISNP